MDSYLQNMISYWHSLKKIEHHYHNELNRTEVDIQNHLQKLQIWKDNGMMDFDSLKISTCLNRKWNQKTLVSIKNIYQLTASQFPFYSEYKELKTLSDYLQEEEPHIWEKLELALRIYPSKPLFSEAKHS